jgi:hypothetical protein
MAHVKYSNLGLLTIKELSWDAHSELFRFLKLNIDEYYGIFWKDNMTTAIIMADDDTIAVITKYLEENNLI